MKEVFECIYAKSANDNILCVVITVVIILAASYLLPKILQFYVDLQKLKNLQKKELNNEIAKLEDARNKYLQSQEDLAREFNHLKKKEEIFKFIIQETTNNTTKESALTDLKELY
jgi:predicted Holliday junction resolvase-like endonuclease